MKKKSICGVILLSSALLALKYKRMKKRNIIKHVSTIIRFDDKLKKSVNSPIDFGNMNVEFFKDIGYDKYKQTVFDIFIPESDNSTPLVVYIHGGGFVSGDKSYIYDMQQKCIKELLKNNIAFASINYRLLHDEDRVGVIKCLNDSKRCLQFIKYNSDVFNIDKDNVALIGSSAGAGTSLWLAFHDDMSDHKHKDPIMRESTKVKTAVAIETQATYDFNKWQDILFSPYKIKMEELLKSDMKGRLLAFYGIDDEEKLNSDNIKKYVQDIDLLGLMNKNCPEIWIKNEREDLKSPINPGLMYHHAYHAKALKERADKIGLKCRAYIPKLNIKDEMDEDFLQFILRKLVYENN